MGKSAAAEALQLACTCFMTILVLQPIWNGEITAEALEKVVAEAKTEIEFAMGTDELEYTITLVESLEQHLVELLGNWGIGCHIDLICDRDGRIEEMQYRCADSQMAEAAEILANYTGLSEEKIIYIGEEREDAR